MHADNPRRGASTPSRATPITFALREDLPWLLEASRGDAAPAEPAHGPSRDVLDALRARGALFHSEIGALTGRLPVEIEEGLWDLVSRGIVTADGFQAVRSLLSAREAWRRRHRNEVRNRVGRGRAPDCAVPVVRGVGLLLPEAQHSQDPDSLAESVAGQLLARWGVVFWDLVAHEELSVPWRQLLWALRRLEARGLVRGGRFVTGFVGEQFALPEAVDHLRRLRRAPRAGEVIRLNAADPLNLTGIILPGPARARSSYQPDLLLRRVARTAPRIRRLLNPTAVYRCKETAFERESTSNDQASSALSGRDQRKP